MSAEDIEQEWVVGRCRAPFVMSEPDPHRPDLVLLLDVEAGRVSAFTTVPHEAANQQVASWVEENAPPGADLRVADAGLASALRSEGGHDRFVYVGDTPEFDAVVDEIRGNIRRHRPRGKVPAQLDESSSAVRRAFYEAAARFDDVAPWTLASDQMVMGVSIPKLGWTEACAVVLGEAGPGYGLSLFRSLRDYLTLTDIAAVGEEALGYIDELDLDVLGVSFDVPKKAPGGWKLAKRARALGWRPGPRGFVPWLIHLGDDGVLKRLTTDDYRLAIAGLMGVAAFLRAHGRLLHEGIETPLATTAAVETDAGSVDVQVYVPLEDPPPLATPTDVH